MVCWQVLLSTTRLIACSVVASRRMTGLISVFVWAKSEWGALELLNKQNVAVYDAKPGAEWDGFGNFLANVAKEYSAVGVWAAKPDRNRYPPEPPDPLRASSPRSLLDDPPAKIQFPERGTLQLVILAASAIRAYVTTLGIGDATEWCALYDVQQL